jgi:hypothetical protein
MGLFVIPAEYCVALIDAAAYPSFVDEEWTLPQIRKHFTTQMNGGTMLAWGTGASGNWRIRVAGRAGAARIYRAFTGRITATGKKLHLTSYDELTMAAQFENVRMPEKGTEGWFIPVKPGEYDCRVTQLYDPAKAESAQVFKQTTPHFLLNVAKAKGSKASVFKQVPWFVEGRR